MNLNDISYIIIFFRVIKKLRNYNKSKIIFLHSSRWANNTNKTLFIVFKKIFWKLKACYLIQKHIIYVFYIYNYNTFSNLKKKIGKEGVKWAEGVEHAIIFNFF